MSSGNNIILQHWSGPSDKLTRLSVENIKAYADKVGADHRLMTGECFQKGLTAPCQKLIMLDKQFDLYDTVVMMDTDMFTRTNLTKNIFEEKGMGRHYNIQETLVVNLAKKFPLLGNARFPYWGGSIYKFDREHRILLREQITQYMLTSFTGNYEDEGIMHACAVSANLPINEHTYLEKDKWNKSSFEKNVADSYIVHIRPKIIQGGPKRPKIENYQALVERGLI